MTKHRREYLVTRRNWTRTEQQDRIMLAFRFRYQHGDFRPCTAQEMCHLLEIKTPDHVKDIMLEMVAGGLLTETKLVHRTRADGSQIIKSHFHPADRGEWIAMYYEHMDQ